MSASVTWRQVAAWRTRKHSLDVRRPAADALDVVSELCGPHAQLMSSAGATLRDVRLLPAFEQYVVAATRQATHFLEGGSPDQVYRPQGWLSPVLMVDGMPTDVWSQERGGGRMADRVDVHWAE
ncbi:hypothetical protein [Saccharothrix sp. HUAS TT1]|uniref:hypothetical protein n=1 Tax=unclassified Saccharothrix TaxID=2593673 RepID=UPI00345BAE67